MIPVHYRARLSYEAVVALPALSIQLVLTQEHEQSLAVVGQAVLLALERELSAEEALVSVSA